MSGVRGDFAVKEEEDDFEKELLLAYQLQAPESALSGTCDVQAMTDCFGPTCRCSS